MKRDSVTLGTILGGLTNMKFESQKERIRRESEAEKKFEKYNDQNSPNLIKIINPQIQDI